MKLSHIVIAADIAAVAYVEKVLMAPHVVRGHVVHTAPKELVVVGLVFALPTLIILLVAWLRGRASAAKAVTAAPRPTYSSFRTPR